MTEIDEVRVRVKNQITIPTTVVDILNLSPGDYIRFEQINGNICICKAVTRKVNTNCGMESHGSSSSP